MKTFQKIALVSAIAAAPFAAQADLTPMDDSLMGNTTGQAGVTIEIDLGDQGVKIGEVVYTDTAHQVDDVNGVAPGDAGYIATTADGGKVSLENIHIGLDGTLVQTIDVSEAGDLEMTVTAPGVMSISMGNNLAAIGTTAADTTGQFSGLKLRAVDGSESEIINNLSMNVELGASTTTIKNLGTAGTLGMGNLGTLVDGTKYQAMNSSMAIQMTASAKITDLDVGLFGYTNAQAVARSSSAATQYAGGNANAVALGYTDAADFRAKNEYISQFDANSDGAIDGAELTALENATATGSAVSISGVSITNATDGGLFSVDQTIWAIGGDASKSGSTAGVYIQMGAMDLNIGVDSIAIGGNSIGGVEIKNLEMAGLTQRIYGH